MNVDHTERMETAQSADATTPSFDRMRNMLVRAVEVRESEQQQIFDALDDIYARLAPVDSLGAVRKRLSELPDRTELSVLAERLDEVISKIEGQGNAIDDLKREVLVKMAAQEDAIAELNRSTGAVLDRLDQIVTGLGVREDTAAESHHDVTPGSISRVTGDPVIDLLVHRAGEEIDASARPCPSVDALLRAAWTSAPPEVQS